MWNAKANKKIRSVGYAFINFVDVSNLPLTRLTGLLADIWTAAGHY